jgi:opacity protein-like surface antigen
LHATYSASSSNRFGSVVGGGFEYAWSPGTTLKVEYQHLRFDNPDVTGYNPTLLGLSLDASALTSRARVTADIVRVGLNYKLGN